MMLREDVTIKTATGTLNGRLFVGYDHLPEVEVDLPTRIIGKTTIYTPASFPAAWELQHAEPDAGILFCAWRTIMEMQWKIARAQRKAEEVRDANG